MPKFVELQKVAARCPVFINPDQVTQVEDAGVSEGEPISRIHLGSSSASASAVVVLGNAKEVAAQLTTK
jgi:hypothetical protein